MPLNKCNFDFHLLPEGWLSVTPYNGYSEAPASPPGTLASIRMVEFGSDDKPDLWYKAEIIDSDGKNSNQIKALFEKFGLPNAVLVNCSAQKGELRDHLVGTE